MFERECAVYTLMREYARRLLADVDDARLADQPAPGVNHPAWLIGHLAVCTDSALVQLGGAACLPPSWPADFGTGSLPRPDRSSYPAKAELWNAYEAGHARVEQAARKAAPEAMDRPHGLDLPPVSEYLSTVGDLVVHLMTAHEGMHLGHLSNWRRQVGLPFLF